MSNEELQNKILELETELEELKNWKKSLESSYSIPLNIDQSFKGRFGFLVTSTKVSSTENQAVAESGSASYSVLKPPDNFLQITIKGTTYYIPSYT